MIEWIPDSVGSFIDTYHLSAILGDLEDLVWHDPVIEVARLNGLRSTLYAV